MDKEIEKFVKKTVKEVFSRERPYEEAFEKLRVDLEQVDTTENENAKKDK